MSVFPSAHFISFPIVKEISIEKVIFFIFYAFLFFKFKRINQLLPPEIIRKP